MSRAPDDLGACLVTGAAGYLGSHLVGTLRKRGIRVRGIDVAADEEADRVDVLDRDALGRAMAGIDTVFHTVAIIELRGWLDATAEQRAVDVNVTGTQNVIDAALHAGVQRLVHTSSNNVVFDRPIYNGGEHLSYATHTVDVYTRTKIAAEKAVLTANGRGGLFTCALRPGGIWGPGPGSFLDRVVEAAEGGRFLVFLGSGSAIADNIHVDSLVDAEIRAAERLGPDSPVPGRAYFVSDGEPMNAIEFARPLLQNLDLPFPRVHIPAGLGYAIATTLEAVHFAGGPRPFLTRIEVQKITVTHYFDIEPAKRDLQWQPLITTADGMREAARTLRPMVEELRAQDRVVRPHPGWWISVIAGMSLLALLAFNDAAYAWWCAHVTDLLARPVLQWMFAGAAALHIGEALYAWRRAQVLGSRLAIQWGLQTLILGYPSLRLLLARLAEGE